MDSVAGIIIGVVIIVVIFTLNAVIRESKKIIKEEQKKGNVKK